MTCQAVFCVPAPPLLLSVLLLMTSSAASQLICVPLVTCPELMEDPHTNLLGRENACFLRDSSDGGLCSDGVSTSAFSLDYLPPPRPTADPADTARTRQQDEPLRKRLRRYEQLIIHPEVPEGQFLDVICSTEKQLLHDETLALKLALRGVNLALPDSPEALQQLFAQPQRSAALALGLVAQISAAMLAGLAALGAISVHPLVDDVAVNPPFALPEATGKVLERGSRRIPNCTPASEPECDEATRRYRTHDGSCNNMKFPRTGRAHSQYTRYFPSAYDDGVSAPRVVGVGGTLLPSARRVSAAIAAADVGDDGEDGFRTIALTLFGQFVDHDITSTPEFALESAEEAAETATEEAAEAASTRTSEVGGFSCCHRNGSFPPTPLHPVACNPIRVPSDDAYFSRHGVQCLNQVRSLPAPSDDCLARPRAQQNQITHFLDGSNIYGSSDKESAQLRAFSGGRIKTTDPGRLLPRDSLRCSKHPEDCFVSGDHRAGENIGLAFIHLVWTREHNRVATALATRHPEYDDEELYQEARRVVIGEYQHIVYREFLPATLGHVYVRDHGLKAAAGARVAAYSEESMPTITSEFSSAAFRFGHSMVHDMFDLERVTAHARRVLPIEKTFFNSTFLSLDGIVTQLAHSLTGQRPGRVDTSFTSAITERLFAKTGKPGLDLIALNIQRGREHGLPGYVTALENCAERGFRGWDDLEAVMEPEAVKRLKELYDDYRDVDLFVGGVSERRVSGAVVGFTFQCIIAEQFFDLRYADRFFYDIVGKPNSFTDRQVEQLQQASFARILCDNVDGLTETQQLAFYQTGFFLNSRQSCDDLAIPTVDLTAF